MANSKLLKEAIADAKAVRETAIANAKIALEEAFTPRLQSMLTKKIQSEMEGEDMDDLIDDNDMTEFNDMDDDSEFGTTLESDEDEFDMDMEEDFDMDLDMDEEFDMDYDIEENDDLGYNDPTNADDASISEEYDDDDLDLESIIRELEMDADSDDDIQFNEEFDDEEELDLDEVLREMDYEDDIDTFDEDMDFDDDVESFEEDMDMDDEIDLDEVLREMGYGDDDEGVYEMEDFDAGNSWDSEKELELESAYSTIKKLKRTINEVNLLNAKLLYANRLFRSYNLNNEQKAKVVENLDRTTSVREVKLVYATLAESMNFTGTERKLKRAITESISSKALASTAPRREILSESNELANRFKQLAGIVKG